MLAEIIHHLGPHPWADSIHYFDTIDSTNTYAKKLAMEGAPAGTVVAQTPIAGTPITSSVTSVDIYVSS